MKDALAELVAAKRIAEVKARYFRGVDTQDWELVAAQFAPDAVLRSRGSEAHGREAIIARMRSVLDGGGSSVHHGFTPEIEVTGSTATAIWVLEDLVTLATGEGFHGYGHYHDTYAETGGEWLITSSHLTRLRVDPLTGTLPAVLGDVRAP